MLSESKNRWQWAVGSRRASAERRNKDLEGAAATFALITEWVRFVNLLKTAQVKKSAERFLRAERR